MYSKGSFFSESLGVNSEKMLGLGSTHSIHLRKKGYFCLQSNSKLENQTRKPQGKSYVSNTTISNALSIITSLCDTVTWSMCRHIIMDNHRIKSGSIDMDLGNTSDSCVIDLPDFHRLMSCSEFFQQHKKIHPGKKITLIYLAL